MIKIRILPSPHTFAANTYLLSDGKEHAIIDPTAPFEDNLFEGELKYILLTHAHFDHILEVNSWVQNTSAKVYICEDEREALNDPTRNCFKLYNGTDNGYFGDAVSMSENNSLPFGESFIRMIKTPGHTIGSACFIIDSFAFVGDTVFERGGFGRYDLPTGSILMLRDSINKVLSLPEDTVLYPGHGGSTTVKQYKKDFRG